MKLVDLNPRWVGSGGPGITDSKTGEPVPRREGMGITFDCPCGCDEPVFVHVTPLDGGPSHPQAKVWDRTGEDFESMTLSPSLQRVGGCGWHGFVRNGEIIFA